jgi:NAD(P)-dependent dehydrogenase (short-subunit alcohol dehydrogenase family)
MPDSVKADLAGKVFIVTGASAGIGKATAKALAGLGACVVMAVRDREKGERARAEIAPGAGDGTLELAVVDLASQASIRSFASDVSKRLPRLDVLVNNAGVWLNARQLGPEGIERTWATNVLGYFLTTELLLPLLRAAGRARVVNVASQLAGGLKLDDVGFERRRYDGQAAYAQSKQADRLLTWELARRLEGSGVTANAMHPGFVATEIFGKGGGLTAVAASAYSKLGARTPDEGADTVVYLAASAEVNGRSGVYWIDRREHTCPFRDARQEQALVALCRSMTGANA